MNIQPGDKTLITCDNWFYGPDGRAYRAVFGTVKAVLSDTDTLGIKTNAKSTNWYVEIGCVTIAGCQIHYAVKCSGPPPIRVADEREADGQVRSFERGSHVFDADQPA